MHSTLEMSSAPCVTEEALETVDGRRACETVESRLPTGHAPARLLAALLHSAPARVGGP